MMSLILTIKIGHSLGGKKWIILHLKCLSFHPEMGGKCWTTIIRNHSFHKSLHLIGMFSFILDGMGSDCNIKSFLQYLTCIYTNFIRLWEFFKKNTKNGLLSRHIATLASSEQGVQRTTASF